MGKNEHTHAYIENHSSEENHLAKRISERGGNSKESIREKREREIRIQIHTYMYIYIYIIK